MSPKTKNQPQTTEAAQLPIVPTEVTDVLAEHMLTLITTHLPPVWAEAVEMWGVLYAQHKLTPASLAALLAEPYDNLLRHLAAEPASK